MRKSPKFKKRRKEKKVMATQSRLLTVPRRRRVFVWDILAFISLSSILDGLAAVALTILEASGIRSSFIRLVIFTPGGWAFLKAGDAGLSPVFAFLLFAIGTGVTNGIGGLALGQRPSDPLVMWLALAIGATSMVFGLLGNKGEEDGKPDAARELLFYTGAAIVTIVGVAGKNWFLLLLAFSSWDLSAVPIYLRLRDLFEKSGDLKPWVRGFAIEGLRFAVWLIPSFVYSILLLSSSGLLEVVLAAHVASAVLAPLFVKILYPSARVNWGFVAVALATGLPAVIAMRWVFA